MPTIRTNPFRVVDVAAFEADLQRHGITNDAGSRPTRRDFDILIEAGTGDLDGTIALRCMSPRHQWPEPTTQEVRVENQNLDTGAETYALNLADIIQKHLAPGETAVIPYHDLDGSRNPFTTVVHDIDNPIYRRDNENIHQLTTAMQGTMGNKSTST